MAVTNVSIKNLKKSTRSISKEAKAFKKLLQNKSALETAIILGEVSK